MTREDFMAKAVPQLTDQLREKVLIEMNEEELKELAEKFAEHLFETVPEMHQEEMLSKIHIDAVEVDEKQEESQ